MSKEQDARYAEQSGSINNPYLRAAEVIDGRYGSALSQARNWRFFAVFMLLTNLTLGALLAWLAIQPKEVPYVVVVDQLGREQAIRQAFKEIEPTERQEAFVLTEWLRWVRSKPLDEIAFWEQWDRAEAYLTREGKMMFDRLYEGVKIDEGLGTIARQVQITSLRRVGADGYELNWTERTFERGALLTTEAFRGSFTVTVDHSQASRLIGENPLGIFISSVAWGEDFAAIGGN